MAELESSLSSTREELISVRGTLSALESEAAAAIAKAERAELDKEAAEAQRDEVVKVKLYF